MTVLFFLYLLLEEECNPQHLVAALMLAFSLISSELRNSPALLNMVGAEIRSSLVVCRIRRNDEDVPTGDLPASQMKEEKDNFYPTQSFSIFSFHFLSVRFWTARRGKRVDLFPSAEKRKR